MMILTVEISLVTEIFHHAIMAIVSCQMQEGPLMERKKYYFNTILVGLWDHITYIPVSVYSFQQRVLKVLSQTEAKYTAMCKF